MEKPGAMLAKGSKVFFAVFFVLIIASVSVTFYTIHVEGRYQAFTEDDDIPEPVDFYIEAYQGVASWFLNPHF